MINPVVLMYNEKCDHHTPTTTCGEWQALPDDPFYLSYTLGLQVKWPPLGI